MTGIHEVESLLGLNIGTLTPPNTVAPSLRFNRNGMTPPTLRAGILGSAQAKQLGSVVDILESIQATLAIQVHDVKETVITTARDVQDTVSEEARKTNRMMDEIRKEIGVMRGMLVPSDEAERVRNHN